jgi:hypothetical protein
MNNSQLLLSIQTLSEKEKERFEQFLHSPYHNQQAKPIELWQELKHKSLENCGSKAELFAQIWPEESYRDQRMRDVISQLFRLLKQFWVLEEQQKDSPRQKILLLRQLKKRRLARSFRIEAKGLAQQLQQSPKRERRHWQHSLWLAEEEDEFFALQAVRKADSRLQEKMHALDRYYLIEKFQQACEMLNRQRIVEVSYEMPLLESLIDELKKDAQSYLNEPAINIYLQVLLTLQGEADYQELARKLIDVPSFMAEEEARALFKYAQNHCIRQSNAGKREFLQKLFDLYQLQLKNGLLFRAGKMSHTDFKNIVTVSLRLKAFDWTQAFIEQYHQSVAEPHRANVYRFCQANYHYEKGDLRAALSELQGLEFTDVHYQISARVLLLKVFYRQEDQEAARYSIKAFEGFLKRNKELPAGLRQSNLHFLTWTKRLLRLQEKKFILNKKDFKSRHEAFMQTLTADRGLSNKSWVLEEGGELGK